jgi:arabinofuranan 3-O-arabinosyltransferase
VSRAASTPAPVAALTLTSLALLMAYALFFGNAFVHSLWVVNLSGQVIDVDFTCFWAAGRLALQGRAAAAYDWSQLREFVAAAGSPLDAGTLPWSYPPMFLIAVTPLALLSCGAAAMLWLGITLSAYLVAIYAIVPRALAVMVAAAAPVVFCNATVGQNGLLTAALLGGALVLLDERPVIAGILVGALCYKPHFGLLLPLVLAATGRWRVFASAAATVIVLAAIAGTIFGWDTFAAFAKQFGSANQALLEHGTLPWSKWQSIYGLSRVLGLGGEASWAVQIAVAAIAAAATLAIWRSSVSDALKAATLSTAVVIVTPYSVVYDLAVLAVPTAFLVKEGLASGFRRWEGAALVVAMLLPFAFLDKAEPVGPIMGAILAAMIARRVGAGLTARAQPQAPAG